MVDACSKIAITHFQQEQDYSCGAAIARSVLFSLFEIEVNESKLVSILETNDQSGTKRRAFLNLLNPQCEFGTLLSCFTETNGTFQQIADFLSTNYLVAVNYIEKEHNEGHWALVSQIDAERICLSDPWHGSEYSLPLDEFRDRWRSGFLDESGLVEYQPWVVFRCRSSF